MSNMARDPDTFLLRIDVDTNSVTQVQDTLDVSAYVNVPEGEVLVIRRAWINFCNESDGHGVVGSASAANTSPCVSASATTRSFTAMQPSSEPSMISKAYLHWANDGSQDLQFYKESQLLDPAQYTAGFVCAAPSIQCTVDCSVALSNQVRVSFIFECNQVKLTRKEALAKAVSLTQ